MPRNGDFHFGKLLGNIEKETPMLLKSNKISDLDTWFQYAPPMGGIKQWCDGRSAKELARYITADMPKVPSEIERMLSVFTSPDAEFEWAGEYVTKFADYGLGFGEGRNHDAFMWNEDVVVGIEGKADESLGSQLIRNAIIKAGENKMRRISGMIKMLFGDAAENHKDIRYQLVTATSGTLLEAKSRGVSNAVFLVIVFKKNGCYRKEKITRNKADIERFLSDIKAIKQGDYYEIPTMYGKENDINLYFQYIEINLDQGV
jgi:hypothetical protein